MIKTLGILYLIIISTMLVSTVLIYVGWGFYLFFKNETTDKNEKLYENDDDDKKCPILLESFKQKNKLYIVK